MEGNLRQIHFVTRRYAALRDGVSRAIWAPCILSAGVVEHFNSFRGIWALVFGLSNIVGFSALGIGLWLWARRWMDRRFGRVRSGNLLLDMWLGNLWLCAYLGASFFDNRYAVGTGLPSLRFLIIGAGAIWCSVRLWPYSVHYLLAAAVAFGFAIPFAELRGEETVELWEIRAFAATLLAWTAAGLIDLARLNKGLPQRPDERASVDAT